MKFWRWSLRSSLERIQTLSEPLRNSYTFRTSKRTITDMRFKRLACKNSTAVGPPQDLFSTRTASSSLSSARMASKLLKATQNSRVQSTIKISKLATSLQFRSSCGSSSNFCASSSRRSIRKSCRSVRVLGTGPSQQRDLLSHSRLNTALIWPRNRFITNSSWTLSAQINSRKNYQKTKLLQGMRQKPTLLSTAQSASRWRASCWTKNCAISCLRVPQSVKEARVKTRFSDREPFK